MPCCNATFGCRFAASDSRARHRLGACRGKPPWRLACCTMTCCLVVSAGLAALAEEPVRLTHDGAFKFSPSFAARGQEVLYSVHDVPNRVSMVRLRLADKVIQYVDPSLKAHQLDPIESPDGRFLSYCLSSTSPQTVLVLRDRREQTQSQFTPTGGRSTARGPRISPDQTKIVFTVSQAGGQQIASVDVDGGNFRNLTESAGTNCYADFSPDGKQIAFCSSRGGSFNIYLMDADGGRVRQLTEHPLRDLRPAWSPDGSQIAFTSVRDGNHEIYLIRTDKTNLRRLTVHPDRDDYPIWHPNGRQLLIVSERDGDSDLYLINVPYSRKD